MGRRWMLLGTLRGRSSRVLSTRRSTQCLYWRPRRQGCLSSWDVSGVRDAVGPGRSGNLYHLEITQQWQMESLNYCAPLSDTGHVAELIGVRSTTLPTHHWSRTRSLGGLTYGWQRRLTAQDRCPPSFMEQWAMIHDSNGSRRMETPIHSVIRRKTSNGGTPPRQDTISVAVITTDSYA